MSLYQPQGNNSPKPSDNTFFILLGLVVLAIATAVVNRLFFN